MWIVVVVKEDPEFVGPFASRDAAELWSERNMTRRLWQASGRWCSGC